MWHPRPITGGVLALAIAILWLQLPGRSAPTPSRTTLSDSPAPPPPAVAPPGLPIDPDFAGDPLWDDGRAEIDIFDATEIRYDEPRPARVVHIVVKEDLLEGAWVKAEDWRRPGTVAVLKLNWVLDIPTGVYRYNQMVSVFLRRSDLAFVRETLTSHEWCGNTWKGLLSRPGGALLEFRTYWEGEASGSLPIDWPAGTVAADALPLLLRALPLERAGEYPVPVAPSLIGSRVGATTPDRATVLVQPAARLPEGPPVPAALVTVKTAGGNHRWWIEVTHPRRLLRWERPDGAVYRLVRSRRLAYWDQNAPADAGKLLEGRAFDPPLGRHASAEGARATP